MNALYPGAGEDGHLGRDFFRQASVHPATVARVLALGVFPHHHPVDLLAIDQRAFDPGQYTRRAYVGVLVEALADRQAQAPE
ncbi:hypothetical protein D9M73_258740 [compost metagenome]